MEPQTPVYRRIILKLSGEALMGSLQFGIDPGTVERITGEINELVSLGVQVGLVVGGGNLFRGAALSAAGLGRITGDHMGMLGTVMNALALRDMMEQKGLQTRVMSAIPMSGIIDTYDRRKAMHHLAQGRVVIFSGGTGNPLVTTDSAASLRSIEVDADILLKATNVDGVYTADPARHKDATLYHKLSFQEVLEKELGVMDLAAFCQCRDHNVPIRVFNIKKNGALLRILMGGDEGTLVTNH
jgi:uridylate kinase